MNTGVSLLITAFIIIGALVIASQLFGTTQRLPSISPSVAHDPNVPSITVLSPNGGEVLKAGQVYPIRWDANKVGDVYIRLLQGGKDHGYIVSAILANEGLYNWTVPSDVVANFGESGYKIVIDDNNVQGVSDASDAPFTIKK